MVYWSAMANSFGAFHAWEMRGRTLVECDGSMPLSRQALTSFNRALYHVGFEPGGASVLVVDYDHLLARARWPSAELVVKHVDVLAPWRGAHRRVTLWPEEGRKDDFELVLSTDFVAHIGDVIVMPVVKKMSRVTHALLVIDAVSLLPLGMVRPPKHRFRNLYLRHCGGNLFAASGKTRTRIWRLHLT